MNDEELLNHAIAMFQEGLTFNDVINDIRASCGAIRSRTITMKADKHYRIACLHEKLIKKDINDTHDILSGILELLDELV